MNDAIGWDIGGAHLKAAVVDGGGALTAVIQKPCPLWLGLDRLIQAVEAVLSELPRGSYRHALTMTGELVDLFAGRDEGVMGIVRTMRLLLPDAPLRVYAGDLGFVDAAKINRELCGAIASANWLASASYAAQQVGSGLFVDVGSTTSDILLLARGRVLAEGYSDYERLVTRELVYTGIVRTAVMAVAERVVDQGREVGLMAEYFATMADVYRLTGELNERHDQADTADGGGKTVAASARRLARMIGCDFIPQELSRWRELAEHLRAVQLQKIRQGCDRQLSRMALPDSSPLIGAGVGRFLVRRLAISLERPYVDFAEWFMPFSSGNGLDAADCAPAVAVACLSLAR